MMTMKRLWLVAVLTLCVGATASAYDLTVAQSEHGSVGFSVGGTTVTTAEAGEVVTITVTPDEGYTTKSVTARAYTTWEAAARRAPGLIDDITATKQQDGTWQFTMPEANVQVKVEYYADLPETNDGSWIAANDGQTADIRLGRTLQTGSWNTFCVPFSMTLADFKTAIGDDNVLVKELTASSFNSSTGALSLTFGNAASIVAGKPYLVKVTGNVANPAFDGVTISKTAVTTETTATDFVATLGLTEVTVEADEALFLGTENELLYPSEAKHSIKGFSAYFLLKGEAAQARSCSMDLGDGETVYKVFEYTVMLMEGTDDAGNWKAKAGEGELKVLPLEGVKKGQTVTVKYDGTRRVKSVKVSKLD